MSLRIASPRTIAAVHARLPLGAAWSTFRHHLDLHLLEPAPAGRA